MQRRSAAGQLGVTHRQIGFASITNDASGAAVSAARTTGDVDERCFEGKGEERVLRPAFRQQLRQQKRKSERLEETPVGVVLGKQSQLSIYHHI